MHLIKLEFVEHPVGNAVLSVPTAKRHIFVLQIMEIIRILGHRTPKFFRNAEDSVPYSVFRQSDKLQFIAQKAAVPGLVRRLLLAADYCSAFASKQVTSAQRWAAIRSKVG